MRLLPTLSYLFRLTLLTLSILIIVLHDPAFLLLIDALLTIRSLLRSLLTRFFPAAVQSLQILGTQAGTYICHLVYDVLAALGPFVRDVLVKLAAWIATMVHASPAWLCAVNQGIVTVVREYVVGMLREEGLGVAQEWQVIGAEVERFCGVVVGRNTS